jgi:hypothetical protein
MKRIVTIIACSVLLSGCESYKKTGPWAPDGLNYTLSRDRHNGDQTDYFGVSWSLK